MKIINKIYSLAIFLTVAMVSFSCTDADKVEIARFPSIIEALNADAGKYSILRDAIVKTGLNTTLSSAGSYTIFAPNNAAFTAAGLTSANINALTSATDIANLRVQLLNHVIGGGTRLTDLVAAGYSRTFGFYRLNAPTPVAGQTGIITANNANQMSMFVNQVGTDVLINGGVSNNGAKVLKADIEASNGIIYEIDAVLALPTIVNHLVANPSLSTLLSVVTSTSGAFGNQAAVAAVFTTATNAANSARTLFAPNNAAFTTATAPGGFLVGRSAADVTRILQYHYLVGTGARLREFFLPARPPATPVDFFIANTAAPTAQTFRVSNVGELGNRIEDNSIVVGRNIARFVTTDIVCVNGIIHIVDKVLEPTL